MTGTRRFNRHAALLLDADGKLSFDRDTLRVAARSALIDMLSCRLGHTNSGVVSRIAGDAIGADGFFANMATEAFLDCLSRPSLEASCVAVSVLPRQRVPETRAALVEHYKSGLFVHPAALFAPDVDDLADILKVRDAALKDDDGPEDTQCEGDGEGDGVSTTPAEVVDGDKVEAGGDTPADEIIIEGDSAYSIAAE